MMGYYSFIQHCPDRTRSEALNIAVAAFFPEENLRYHALDDRRRKLKNIMSGSPAFSPVRAALVFMKCQTLLKNSKSISDFMISAHSMPNDLVVSRPIQIVMNNAPSDFYKMYERFRDDSNPRNMEIDRPGSCDNSFMAVAADGLPVNFDRYIDAWNSARGDSRPLTTWLGMTNNEREQFGRGVDARILVERRRRRRRRSNTTIIVTDAFRRH